MQPIPPALFKFPLKKTSTHNFEQKIKLHGLAPRWHPGVCAAATNARESFAKHVAEADRATAAAFAECADRVRESALHYLGCLSGFLFAPGSGGAVESRARSVSYFYWSACLSTNSNFADNNSFYECCCVLVNLALVLLNAAHFRAALLSPAHFEAGSKECYQLCAEAAGVLQLAERLFAGHVARQPHAPREMAAEFIGALALLALAQAQELGVLKAVAAERDRQAAGEEKAPELSTKLVHQCHRLYDEAWQRLRKEETPEEAFQSLLRYVGVKRSVFHALTLVGTALVRNRQQDNGAAMRAARQASLVADEAVAAAKDRKCPKYLQPVAAAVKAEAEAKIVKFDKENTMIYHAKVADEVPEPPPPQVLARARPFELPPAHELWTPEAYDAFVVTEAPQQ